MRLNQDGGLGGIAEHRRDITLAQLLDDFTSVLDDDERDAIRSQRGADAPADTAVADDYHMPRQAIGIDGGGQHGIRIIRARQTMGAAVIMAAQFVDDGSLP